MERRALPVFSDDEAVGLLKRPAPASRTATAGALITARPGRKGAWSPVPHRVVLCDREGRRDAMPLEGYKAFFGTGL